jgi:hypothetical protein
MQEGRSTDGPKKQEQWEKAGVCWPQQQKQRRRVPAPRGHACTAAAQRQVAGTGRPSGLTRRSGLSFIRICEGPVRQAESRAVSTTTGNSDTRFPGCSMSWPCLQDATPRSRPCHAAAGSMPPAPCTGPHLQRAHGPAQALRHHILDQVGGHAVGEALVEEHGGEAGAHERHGGVVVLGDGAVGLRSVIAAWPQRDHSATHDRMTAGQRSAALHSMTNASLRHQLPSEANPWRERSAARRGSPSCQGGAAGQSPARPALRPAGGRLHAGSTGVQRPGEQPHLAADGDQDVSAEDHAGAAAWGCADAVPSLQHGACR